MCVFGGVREGEHQKQAATGIRVAGTNPQQQGLHAPRAKVRKGLGAPERLQQPDGEFPRP